MGSTVSRTSKAGSFIVSKPLSQSEIGSLRQQSKYVAEVSFRGSKAITSHSEKSKVHGAFAVIQDRLFVERRERGGYAIRREGSDRASAVLPTQAAAIARAKELNPDRAPLVERVRNTDVSRPDKWRRA